MSPRTFTAIALEPDALRDAVDADGLAVVTDVLDADGLAEARTALDAAVAASAGAGLPTHVPSLDPNAANVRVFNLPGLHPHFMDLLAHPLAGRIADAVLGEDWIVSNFTANLARPGSGSMTLHSDQGIVVPEPWLERWTVNLIWCLTDARGDNGATRYVPGSHRATTADALPDDAADRLVPFEAPAGSIVVMDGRTWHTSGANRTRDETRALAFAYLTRPFVRAQWNWTAALGPAQQAELDATMRRRLGLDAAANLGLRDLTPTDTGATSG